jgi:hypothetical protein
MGTKVRNRRASWSLQDAPAKVGSPPPNRTVQKSYIEQCHAWQLLIPAGTGRSSLPSNSMLGGGGTTPQDYPQ